jgi:hypothetical protein
MVEVVSVITGLIEGKMNLIFTLFFFTAVIAIYAIFVFYFYKFLAKKNLIELNLGKYNTYENAGLVKFFAAIFYVIEYLIILPIVTFFWFAVLAILLLLLAKNLEVATILIVAASLVASVRATSYVSQNLSQDLAKMLPFTLLGLALTQPGFFSIATLFERTADIPSLFSNIPYYLLFIIFLELIMRSADFISSIFKTKIEAEEVLEQTENRDDSDN